MRTKSAAAPTAVDVIVRATCDAHGLSLAALIGRSRSASLVRARHVAMYVARETLGASYPEIGRAFRRDHTSVMHGVERASAELIAGNPLHLAAYHETLARLGPVVRRTTRRLLSIPGDRDDERGPLLRATQEQLERSRRSTLPAPPEEP